jgi:hypothetical protein
MAASPRHKEIMRKPYLSILVLFILSLLECTTFAVNSNVRSELIVYRDKANNYGYRDKNTLEIIIPAQYRMAMPFVGNFAIVYKKNHALVIDKNNHVQLRYFDMIWLTASEDGKMVIALTENRASYSMGFPAFVFAPGYSGSTMTSGSSVKLFIMTEYGYRQIGVNGLYGAADVQVIGNYLKVGKHLYEFKENNTVKYLGFGNTEQIILQVLADREISTEWKYEMPKYGDGSDGDYIRHNDRKKVADLNTILQIIPEGFSFLEYSYIFKDPSEYLDVYFIKSDELYIIKLSSKVNGGIVTGIYNNTTKKWEIAPYHEETDYWFRNLNPTNDPNIWYDSGERKTSVWDSERTNVVIYNKITNEVSSNYSILIKHSFDFSKHMGYPGVYYVYDEKLFN